MKTAVIIMAMMISLLAPMALADNETTTTTIESTTTTSSTTTTTIPATTTTIPATTTTTVPATTTSTTTTTIPPEIINITEYIPQEVTYINQTEITVVGNNLTASDVQSIVDNMLSLYEQNYTKATLELDVFRQMWDVSCMYSEDRFQELYDTYMGMSDASKKCFGQFITENVTNQIFFSQSCPYAGNAYYAEQILSEYLSNNLAERKCVIIQMPYVQQGSGGQAVSGNTPYQQCNYYPTRVPTGCLKRIDFTNEIKKESKDEGVGLASVVFIVFILIVIFILIARSSGA